MERIAHCLPIVLVFVLSPSPSTYAQGLEAERNATAEEITGDWQQMPFPIAAEPKLLKDNPWPATCQWFSYASTGVLKSIDRTNASCKTMSSGEFERSYPMSPLSHRGSMIYALSTRRH